MGSRSARLKVDGPILSHQSRVESFDTTLETVQSRRPTPKMSRQPLAKTAPDRRLLSLTLKIIRQEESDVEDQRVPQSPPLPPYRLSRPQMPIPPSHLSPFSSMLELKKKLFSMSPNILRSMPLARIP